MAPAFIWTGWYALVGPDRPLPLLLVIGPFLICPVIYWWLIDLGRVKPASNGSETSSQVQVEGQTVLASEASSQLRPITKNEETALRNCFPWGIYYLQHIDYRPQAILCRGKLRAIPDLAYKTIKENIEEVFGDRFFVMFQESFQGQPFFALVPNPVGQSTNKPETEELTRPFLAFVLFLLTFVTTTIFGVYVSGAPIEQIGSNPSLFWEGVPYSFGLMIILAFQEFGQYFTAWYYQIRTTLPYFIPFPYFLGTFGAYIQMRSPIPHRKALFDVAIVGALGGFLATVLLLMWGLSLSELVQLSNKSSLANMDSLNPRFSLLLSLLVKFIKGSQFSADKALDLHPLAVAGYIGLMLSALNLIPVGQLKGGHIVHAMFGQSTAIIVGQITRLLMLFFAFIHPYFWVWAIILWLMPIIDRPTLNDVTELDNWRDFWGLSSLIVSIAIILPLPGAIATWLHI
jgi:hypothetical protein